MRIIIPICFIMLYSCSNRTDNKNNYQDKTRVISRMMISETKEDSLLIEEVEFIPLSTNSDNLIGEINRIIYKNNRFYIFDFMINQSVMVFNKDGGFLYKISNLGRGPGQYISISDFDVDSNGNIFVFDAGGKRDLIKYSNNGKDFKIIKPKKAFVEFKFIDDNHIIVYLPFSEKGIEDCYGILNLQHNKYESLIKKREVIDDNQNFFEISHIFKTNNSIYFSPRFTNDIYILDNKNANKIIEFSNELLPPKEFVKDILNDRMLFYKKNSYVSSISGIYETENVILISFHQNKVKNILLSKSSENTILLENTRNCKFLKNYSIYGSTGGKFISVVTNISSRDIATSCLTEVDKQKLDGINLGANPLLVLFKVKDF